MNHSCLLLLTYLYHHGIWDIEIKWKTSFYSSKEFWILEYYANGFFFEVQEVFVKSAIDEGMKYYLNGEFFSSPRDVMQKINKINLL